MQKTDHKEKRNTILWLLLIYTGSVIIRYLLALATRNYPTVKIDEFLYYSLGRSIATEGSLLYLGQPALYNCIIYPLILSPVYLLFEHGSNYFQLIQLWNIILMSLSVFPFYGLCNAMIGKRKTALWLTGLFMLLPCFILGEYIYSEAVIYPLFYTLMYCVYRYLKENSVRYTAWIGILGALLYYSKPGAVLPAVIALLFFGGKAIVKKSGKAGIAILTGVGCLAVSFFAIKMLADQVFGYAGTMLSVYDNQVIASKAYNIDIFFYAVERYPFYYILAGGVFPFFVSLWNYSEYEKEDRIYYILLIACSLLTMIGVAWVINRPEKTDILYLRYVEMYLPIILVYCAMPKEGQKEITTGHSRKVLTIICCLLMMYMLVCTVLWGCTTGIGNQVEPHSLISLAALYIKHIMGIGNILTVFLLGMTLYLLVRKTERRTINRICCLLFMALVALNNIQGYIDTANNTDKNLMKEAEAINEVIGDQDYIHVYAKNQCDYGLDVNSRRNISQITEEDFLNNIQNNQGVYVPFVPSSVRGMTAAYKTPDIGTLIIDEKVYPRILFGNNTSSFISTYQSFQVVSFFQGERIVDSIMVGSQYPTLASGSACELKVYNAEWLSRPIRMSLDIESQVDQELDIMTNEKQVYTITLHEGRYQYEIEITNPGDEYSLSVQTNDIIVHNYSIITV